MIRMDADLHDLVMQIIVHLTDQRPNERIIKVIFHHKNLRLNIK